MSTRNWNWEELTTPDFVRATKDSAGTCILPIGVIEKHGEHLPLGTDLLTARKLAQLAAQIEQLGLGKLIAAHVIARPSEGVLSLMPR